MQAHVVVLSLQPSVKSRKSHETIFIRPAPAPYPPFRALGSRPAADLPYDLVKVDIRAKTLENGEDYLKLSPKGQVPALGLDSGEIVTEGPAIVQMIADQASATALAPATAIPSATSCSDD